MQIASSCVKSFPSVVLAHDILQNLLKCVRRWSPKLCFGRWNLGSRDAVTTLVEPTPPWTSFFLRTPTWCLTPGYESDGAVCDRSVNACFQQSRHTESSGLSRRSRLSSSQGALRRLPQQRPMTVGQGKQSLSIAPQVTETSEPLKSTLQFASTTMMGPTFEDLLKCLPRTGSRRPNSADERCRT